MGRGLQNPGAVLGLTFRVLLLTSHELYVRQMPLGLKVIADPKYDISASSPILRLWGMLPVRDAGISPHCVVHCSTCQLNSKCLCLIFSVHLERLTSSVSLVMILWCLFFSSKIRVSLSQTASPSQDVTLLQQFDTKRAETDVSSHASGVTPVSPTWLKVGEDCGRALWVLLLSGSYPGSLNLPL